MTDLTITGVDTELVPGHTLVEFSDGSTVLLSTPQYEAINLAGMQFGADIIKTVGKYR